MVYEMRLWTVHPKYLDAKGLVALWREALLAQKVLTGDTKAWKNPNAWKNHPQLDRFKEHSEPIKAISVYLGYVLGEGFNRGYRFNHNKISHSFATVFNTSKIPVSKEWVDSEIEVLLDKLTERGEQPEFDKLVTAACYDKVELHPLFVTGDPE